MDIIDDVSLTTVLTAANGWLIAVATHRYRRIVERRKYRHFRSLVIGRIIEQIEYIFKFFVEDGNEFRKPAVTSSDIVISALVDARFVSDEIPRILDQAVQDTRGRFAGLLGKLSHDFFHGRFVEAVRLFFDPDIRIGGSDDRKSKPNSRSETDPKH